jgi:aryl-alcohol dehydrogenase-like predicted oxidoreductase
MAGCGAGSTPDEIRQRPAPCPNGDRLLTRKVDLYQIHGHDSVTPVEETIRALDSMAQQGKVRYIGCSNWQAWKIVL